MTSGKPPSQRDAENVVRHHSRQLQSMVPGAAGGRLASAQPLPSNTYLEADVDTSDQVSADQLFWNDRHTVASIGTQSIALTFEPIENSEHLYWHPEDGAGIYWDGDLWSRDGQTITVEDPEGLLDVGDTFTIEYAYEDGAVTPDVVETILIPLVDGYTYNERVDSPPAPHIDVNPDGAPDDNPSSMTIYSTSMGIVQTTDLGRAALRRTDLDYMLEAYNNDPASVSLSVIYTYSGNLGPDASPSPWRMTADIRSNNGVTLYAHGNAVIGEAVGVVENAVGDTGIILQKLNTPNDRPTIVFYHDAVNPYGSGGSPKEYGTTVVTGYLQIVYTGGD